MPDTSTNLLLELRDLKIHFFTDEGVVKAVDGVSYSIASGKTLCVVGESGSGKSVAARAILGIVNRPGKVVGGTIHYHKPLPNGDTREIEITSLPPRGDTIRSIRGNEIAMIFQEPMTSLSPLYTVGNQITETIRLHNEISKAEARNRTIELLRRVGIPKPEQRLDEYPFRLSGGMLQRCMIAMALSCNPKLLIADEPTTALDVTTQAQILDLMRELQDDYKMAILFITHDLGVVAEIADDVAVMYLGNVVERGDVDTIFNSPQHPYTIALLNSLPEIGLERRQLTPIRGMVPSPFSRPAGCTFHTRCDKAVAGVCNQVVPVPVVTNPDAAAYHETRCLLYDERYEEEMSSKEMLS
ncbi:MAG: ABC transporter ATP-binding protein [Anaerolineae bacterium]|nr:ABC transporter ATP-binding protein [Anaerolineae bacterium]